MNYHDDLRNDLIFIVKKLIMKGLPSIYQLLKET